MKKGVLLVNLGTPKSTKIKDIRSYLKQFLLDPRVLDVPTWKRLLLVYGIIVPFRAVKTQKMYKEVWTDEGSPLLFHAIKQKALLQEKLGSDYQVELAMRYQQPSLHDAIDRLIRNNVSDIKIIPLFPQYASATTGSVIEECLKIIQRKQAIPTLSWINSFYDHPKMIEVLAERIKYLQNQDTWDYILFSYHGIPERQVKKIDQKCCTPGCCDRVEKNDCYAWQCRQTTRLVAALLKLNPNQYGMSFQSRLGRERWLHPYSDEVLKQLAKEGKKHVIVASPSFVADCLETVFEIEKEYHELFLQEGGQTLRLAHSLNDHPIWIEALQDLATC